MNLIQGYPTISRLVLTIAVVSYIVLLHKIPALRDAHPSLIPAIASGSICLIWAAFLIRKADSSPEGIVAWINWGIIFVASVGYCIALVFFEQQHVDQSELWRPEPENVQEVKCVRNPLTKIFDCTNADGTPYTGYSARVIEPSSE